MIVKRIFLHAPNIHAGGGLTLLNALYSIAEVRADFEQFDVRGANFLPPAKGVRRLVKPTLISRVLADFYLWRHVSAGDVVVCFHGLMPLFPLKGDVMLFLQNRIIISDESLSTYRFKTRLRLYFERLLLRKTSHRARRIVVQTPSMAAQAARALGLLPGSIVVCPFVGNIVRPSAALEKRFDFVYVASADPHKNHLRLLEAWCRLAAEDIRPHLALTLPEASEVAVAAEKLRERYDLRLTNLGVLPVEGIAALYTQSNALIYPSLIESLGLPLLEAHHHGLPVLAGELDYVRDVVEPAETFDPMSAVSISRAVKRFLGKDADIQQVFGAALFWKEMTE